MACTFDWEELSLRDELLYLARFSKRHSLICRALLQRR